jgi:RNA polymerase sigma factor (sigma-70 family)
MSGHTLQTTYNSIYAQNYGHFVGFAQGNRDLVHKVYLNIYNNFQTANFTGKTENEILEKIYGYCKMSIWNTFLTEQRLKKHSVAPDECMHQLEYILQREEARNEDDRTETQQLEYITMKLFEYLKKNYTESEQYVFRCYFLYDKDKRLTYAQLSKLSGYSISKVCGIVQRIKTDLRKNLINYINND